MVGDDYGAQLAVVRTALESGITYFDTAAGYGDGRSEENLGRVLRDLGASPTLSTKVVLEEPDRSDIAGFIAKSVESSLTRLGRDHVEALILHNRVAARADYPKPPGSGVLLHLDDIFGEGGVAGAFRSLIDQGLVSSVGFTAFGGEPAAIEEMIACGLFTSMNASYNVINPSAHIAVPDGFPDPDYQRVIVKAREAGLGVMAIRVLASGALVEPAGPDRRIVRLALLAREIGISRVELAIRFVLSTEGVQTAVLGLTEVDHVLEAVDAASKGSLDADVISEAEAIALDHLDS